MWVCDEFGEIDDECLLVYVDEYYVCDDVFVYCVDE